uniref:Peptidase_M13_N domain-containing protein n=1 Tax=Globodera pallida TaxID=36090 RepID=A0A183BQ74_GLOPA
MSVIRPFSLLLSSVVLLLGPVATCLPSMRLSTPTESSHSSSLNSSVPRQHHGIRQHSAHPFHPMANNPLLNYPLPSAADENRLSDTVEVDASPGFVRAAELFRNSVDERIEPCEDFFEFACGKWVTNNPIPSDLSSYGHFSELREKVNLETRELFDDPEPSTSKAINTLKQLYRGCMNVEDLSARKSSELMAHVERFGYWPIIHGYKWRPEKFDLTELLVNVGRSRAIDVFIDVYVSLDQKNVSRRVLNFDQGGLGLGAGARDYYLNDTRYSKQMAAYGRYMTTKIHTFAADAGIRRSEADIGRDVAEIIKFEKEFAQILIPDEERRNFSKMLGKKGCRSGNWKRQLRVGGSDGGTLLMKSRNCSGVSGMSPGGTQEGRKLHVTRLWEHAEKVGLLSAMLVGREVACAGGLRRHRGRRHQLIHHGNHW